MTTNPDHTASPAGATPGTPRRPGPRPPGAARRLAGPPRTDPPRRHGRRRVRLAGREGQPGDDRLPGGRERLHRGDDRRPGRAARDDLRRDQGPHQGDRPVGAGPQGRLVVLHQDRRGPAVPAALPVRRAAGAGPRRRRWTGTAPLPGEEILLDCNELAGDAAFFSLGAFSVSPDGRLLAYSTDFAGDERYTLRVKDLVTGETAAGRDPRHALRLRLVPATARRCSTPRSTRPGAPTGCGGTWWAPRSPTT